MCRQTADDPTSKADVKEVEGRANVSWPYRDEKVTKLQRKVQQLQEELNHMFRYMRNDSYYVVCLFPSGCGFIVAWHACFLGDLSRILL